MNIGKTPRAPLCIPSAIYFSKCFLAYFRLPSTSRKGSLLRVSSNLMNRVAYTCIVNAALYDYFFLFYVVPTSLSSHWVLRNIEHI